MRTIELQISFLPPYPFCTPERRSTSFSLSGPSWQPQEDRECLSPAETQTTPAPLPSDSTLAQDSPLTAQEMSDSTLTSPLEASWVSSQNDSPSDVSEGPEYLAIGNPAPHGRTASCESHSSSQKLESAASSLGDQEEGRQSQAGSVLRRSSFSEGQTAPVASGTKKSHIRSHSDTNIASRGAAGKDEHQLLGSRVPLNSGGREDLLLRPSDGRGRRNVPA